MPQVPARSGEAPARSQAQTKGEEMNLNRMTTRPLDVPRSRRRHGLRALTSMPAGKVVPIAAVPLLREDAVRSGRMRLSFEMNETAEILMNAVYVDVKAYLVPFLAFERFQGSMDVLNRSYKGQPPLDGRPVIPFVETHAMGAHGSKPIYKYLGLHAKPTTNVNTMIAEAYNLVWNYRAANRSPEITPRSRLDTSLAPAFWKHENFAHIVPDFDQAVIDGEVALNVVAAQLPLSGTAALTGSAPVTGIGLTGTAQTGGARNNVRESTGSTANYTKGWLNFDGTLGTSEAEISIKSLSGGDYPDIRAQLAGNGGVNLSAVFAEMQENGITVSLSNIDLARKTQAFARIREQFAELDDEWVIDMLMDGLSIPDQALKQPMLLAQATNVFGMSKRYSTDADALTASAVNGMTMAGLNIRVPRLATGGVIMVTAEITPEQLFERQKDPFFHLGSVGELPEYLRDTLDPEKVEVVTNDYVDVDHDTPAGTFGYAPLNHKWTGVNYKIGGKFHRPEVNAAFDEDRQRIWAVETENPVLSADFYLCTAIHQKPFLDTVADPFEAVAIADFDIEGNTVFGGVLVEAMNNYQAVMDKAPTDRIEKA
nr:MAG: major capsid protein [Microvirus sp.]